MTMEPGRPSRRRCRSSFFRQLGSSLFLLTFFAAGPADVAAQSFPAPLGRINDFADVIDAAIETELDRRLDEVEQKTSSEIAVVTVTSLGGTTVEDYANRLFAAWGIGQAKQDNGVLVLVAPNEREMRIEVGYGLEGVLPDGLAGEIVREYFIPAFRNDDYSGGIRSGVDRVADIVEAHEVLTPEELARFDSGDASELPVWIGVPFFGLFVSIGAAMLGIGVSTRTFFPLIFGAMFGVMPMLMSLAFLGRLALWTLVPLALVMLVAGFRLGKRPSVRKSFREAGGSSGSSTGWTMGASSSGSSGSSSSGSSSSFGGGSSGGGGASGRW